MYRLIPLHTPRRQFSTLQVSQDIRKRVKGGHQLTYAEHTHLERGGNVRMPNFGANGYSQP